MWNVVMVSALWLPLAFSEPLHSKLMVHIPQSLSREGGYNHKSARFGYPPYSGSIAQNVYYVETSLCPSSVLRPDHVHPTPKGSITSMYPEPPFIMMVDRGDCSDVIKVRNAQHNGAAAVLLVDLCKAEDYRDGCNSPNGSFLDVGSGSDVSIPSVVMVKEDADLIKDVLLVNNMVQVELSWRLPRGQRVEYMLWGNIKLETGLEVLSTFKDVAMSLGERAHFTPHYFLDDADVTIYDDDEIDTWCTNRGRYCFFDDTGERVVTEILRRLCIWNEYGAEDGIGLLWWEYVSLFNDICYNPFFFAHKYCIKDVMRTVGIDLENVDRCMRSSGGLETDAPNAILEKELEFNRERGIVRLPSLTVNDFELEGALTGANLFDAICSAFNPDDVPEICQTCFGCADVPGCVNNDGVCNNALLVGSSLGGSKSKVSTGTFVLSLLFMTTAFGVVGLWYYKRSQAEMRTQVRAIVANYVPLEAEGPQVFMKTKVALVAATWLSLASSDPITSKLRVHIPRALSQDEGYKHTDARFGLPPFGGSISQNVFYADSTLCSPTLQRGQGYPKPAKGGYPEPPFIMMVDRGDCSFVTQVRNAQKNGAAAVLVADTMCVCGVGTSCVKTHSTDDCQRELPTMGDDGSGSDISIPSFLVYKNGADLIKEFLRTNQTVQVEMSWRVPKDDYVVTYELWTSPTDELSRHFIRTFKDVSIRLRERTEFSPHMYLTSFKDVGVDDDSGFLDESCTNHRRYCYTSADNGSAVVRESLRRLCIWEIYGEDYDEMFAGVDGKWWEYSAQYSDLCSNMSVGSQSDCAEDVMARVGIDPDMINECMRNSGGTESDQVNEILEDELLLRDERGINSVPTLIVNGYTVRIAITSTNVFDAICSGFHAEETPDICRGCVGCADVRRCVNNDGICHGDLVLGEPGASKVSSVTFVLSLMFVTTTLAGLGFWYFKRSRVEMRNQVRLILADYVPLEDEDKGGPTMEKKSGSIPCARDGDTAEEESQNPS